MNLTLIDTHAHVNFNAYRDDADTIIGRALEGGVGMILVGSNYKTSKRALDYANKYQDGVWAAVGLHPVHLEARTAEDEDYSFMTLAEDFVRDAYDKLAQMPKVVAIGEIGLDYYHVDRTGDWTAARERQQEAFVKQLLMAREFDKPVIIHCRQAHDDLLALLKELRRERRDIFPRNRDWGVMHCFSGDEDLAWQYFALGLKVSFTGIITFSKGWDDLIRRLPLDRFMVETDSPYLTPEPFRGQRNEPAYVFHVAERIAEIKKISLEKIAEATTRNAIDLFRLRV